MDHYYIQPKYFSEFKCSGGNCPLSCCRDWIVDWKLNEVDNLKSASCSEQLLSIIEQSFILSADKTHYSIKLNDCKICPMQDKDSGLCRIQAEIGEKYLGIVCRQYPRLYIESDDRIIRWCATSCPAVIDYLIRDESAADIIRVPADDQGILDRASMTVDNPENIKLDPIKQVRMELFDFYTDMLLDKSRDFETSVILTGLAVKHLAAAESKADFQSIPQMTLNLKKLLNSTSIVHSIEELKPNYQLKFKLVNNMLVKFFGNASRIIRIYDLYDGDRLAVERYQGGIDRFYDAFDNKPFILRNIMMNIFYDLDMPIGKFKRNLFENYAYYVLVAATVKTVAASIGFSSKNIAEEFRICVSEMNRVFSHSLQHADMIIEDMLQMGINSPAHLAVIIK